MKSFSKQSLKGIQMYNLYRVIYRIEKIVMHPEFSDLVMQYDFALLKLSRDVQFDLYEHIRPVSIKISKFELKKRSNT